MTEKKYSYDRFGSSGTRVGQASYDILSQANEQYTAEEILDEMGKGVVEYLQQAAEQGCKEFTGKFYIIHLFKKALTQHNIPNAMSQKAVCFQKGSTDPAWYMKEKPNDTKTLYEVDQKNGVIKLVWTVPGWQDCKSVLKSQDSHDPQLVMWVKEALKDSA